MEIPPLNDNPDNAADISADNAPEASSQIAEFSRFVEDATTLKWAGGKAGTLRAWVDLAEAYRITQALKECRGNRSAAARRLGIGRRTLYAKMEKLGISASWRIR